MKRLVHICCCIIFASIISCASQKEEVQEEEVQEVEQDSLLSSGYEEELFKVHADIWETPCIYNDMQEAGFSFEGSLKVPPSKIEQYTTNKEKALGLGAYYCYLSFSLVNGQQQEALDGLNAVFELADDLQIQEAFDKELLTGIIEGNIDTTDVAKLLSDAISNALDYMDSNDKEELASIVIVGGWVEGLYVGTSMMKQNKVKRTQKIDVGVWGQNFRYQSIIKMLRVFEGSPDCKELEKILLSIRKPVWYVISKGKIDDLQIESVYAAISDIREKIL